jgi:hypothetical protein
VRVYALKRSPRGTLEWQVLFEGNAGLAFVLSSGWLKESLYMEYPMCIMSIRVSFREACEDMRDTMHHSRINLTQNASTIGKAVRWRDITIAASIHSIFLSTSPLSLLLHVLLQHRQGYFWVKSEHNCEELHTLGCFSRLQN